ncbi:MAG: 50S ribosomal protein L15 [Planctomycetaceae bacterium]
MIIDDVHRGITKHKKRKRIGRGPGSGHGKTAGRGHKGDGARSGYASRRGFQGGQMPLARLIAKRGFNNNAFATKVLAINVSALQDRFEAGETVNVETLRSKGLTRGQFDVVKILGDGELSKKLIVQANRFSTSAEEKIKAAGGTVEHV